MTRRQIKTKINKILQETTKGLHGDPYWKPVKAAFDAMDAAGFTANLHSAEYGSFSDGFNRCKTWKFSVNVEGSKKPMFGVINAHDAGSVTIPFSMYDISAYIS